MLRLKCDIYPTKAALRYENTSQNRDQNILPSEFLLPFKLCAKCLIC